MLALRNNVEMARYEAVENGQLAIVQYTLERDRLNLTYTVMPEALRGRGLGSRLLQAVLEDARDRGLRVSARCPFAKAFIARRREWHGVLV
ncbi:MAG: GNAT family N-acetyltransferase [Pseudomonadota bacterium]